MSKRFPTHWGKDGGDPTPPCEFVIFANWAFGPIPPGQLLGKCDGTIPTTMYVQRRSVAKQDTLPFKVCSTHLGFASETQAQKDGDYNIA
jgi:hypothetical protein